MTCTLWVCLIGVRTCKCKCKRRRHIIWMESCCQKQHRSHVCATNVMLHYFDWMPPLRIILIKDCLCKAIPSSLWKKQLPAGTWQSSGRKCGRSCDEYFGPKMCPSQFHISGGSAKRGGHVQKDLFDLHWWFFICVRLCEIKRVYIFPSHVWITLFHVSMFVCVNICVSRVK